MKGGKVDNEKLRAILIKHLDEYLNDKQDLGLTECGKKAMGALARESGLTKKEFIKNLLITAFLNDYNK